MPEANCPHGVAMDIFCEQCEPNVMTTPKTAPRLTISEDDLMDALLEAKAAARPLIVTKWKDSIDIDEPSYVAICLAKAILSRAAPTQCDVQSEPPKRRRRISDCAYCATINDKGAPMHDASPRCESGKRLHCTCDTCF